MESSHSVASNNGGEGLQQRDNKALHPTAYSLRFGRSSRRFGFRWRVSLVVRPLKAIHKHLM